MERSKKRLRFSFPFMCEVETYLHIPALPTSSVLPDLYYIVRQQWSAGKGGKRYILLKIVVQGEELVKTLVIHLSVFWSLPDHSA